MSTGLPEIRVWITGATTDSEGNPIPNLNNILFQTSLGTYPGDPPSDPSDTAILTYYGGTTDFLYLRTSALNQSVTLGPGLYFAIIVGDENFNTAGLDSYVALAMGAPGGPKLYYTPRGVGSSGSNPILPASWQKLRYNTSTGPFTCERVLNVDLPFCANDPLCEHASLEWSPPLEPLSCSSVVSRCVGVPKLFRLFRQSGGHGGLRRCPLTDAPHEC